MKGENDNGKSSTDDFASSDLVETGHSDRGRNHIRDVGRDSRDPGRGERDARAQGEVRSTMAEQSAGDSHSGTGAGWESFVDAVRRDAAQLPPSDPKATRQWPRMQECVRRVRDAKGRARAGGEVKTVAKGSNYYSTLVMPEEGVQVSVVHNMLSSAWDALEQVLHSEPVPWVECSEFATRRAKQRGKQFQDKT